MSDFHTMFRTQPPKSKLQFLHKQVVNRILEPYVIIKGFIQYRQLMWKYLCRVHKPEDSRRHDQTVIWLLKKKKKVNNEEVILPTIHD